VVLVIVVGGGRYNSESSFCRSLANSSLPSPPASSKRTAVSELLQCQQSCSMARKKLEFALSPPPSCSVRNLWPSIVALSHRRAFTTMMIQQREERERERERESDRERERPFYSIRCKIYRDRPTDDHHQPHSNADNQFTISVDEPQ
jgi:hypothetical protein